MVTRTDYIAEAVEAARSVLLELVRVLGAYRDQVVLIGGWVPELLLPNAEPKHVGSLDIDLALDHRELADSGYRTIQDLLTSRGYKQDERQPFIYRRSVPAGAREITVQVDLLAGEYAGTGPSHRTQQVQDVRPRKTRGCDLALDLATEVKITGRLPGGADDSATIRVATIVPFLVMKGMALADRLKEKDAYDVYFCVRNFPGGVEGLAAEFAPHAGHGLVKEGLRKIAQRFSSPTAFGPTAVADFMQVTELGERDLLRRDAFERLAALLARLDLGSP
jgi:hypothetical protein